MGGSGMLTSKQRWRRVCHDKRVAKTPSAATTTTAAAAGGGGININSGSPHRTNSLVINNCLTRRRDTSVPSKDSEDDRATATVESPSDTTENKDASGFRVRFNRQVRVILVPCVRELHHLSAQLWWGEGDYLNFRREHIRTARLEAADAHRRQQRPHPKQATAAATPTQGESKAIVEPRISSVAESKDAIPRLPFFSASKAEVAATATATEGAPAPAPTLTTDRGAKSPAAAATVVAGVLKNGSGEQQVDGKGGAASISPEARASTAEEAASPPSPPSPSPLLPSSTSCAFREEAVFEGKDYRKSDDEEALLRLPLRTPLLSGHGRRSAAPAPSPCGGGESGDGCHTAAAAAAEQGEGEDGYRTHSMSSVSDSNEYGDDRR